MESRTRIIAVCSLLALCAAVPYLGIGSLGFTNFDDPGYVTENAHVKSGLTPESLSWAATSTEQWNWHPLTWVSHMLDVQVYGMNALGHHSTSLILHLLSTLLLFGVLSSMTGAVWPSAATAALFAVHPLHVESVAWVSERKDVLSSLFWLLAIWAYVRWVESRRRSHALQVFVFFLLGLASKPMVVTLPFVLLLLDYWPLKRFPKAAAVRGKRRGPIGTHRSFRSLIVEKIPLFILSAVSCVITYAVQHREGSVVSFQALPLGARLANAVVSYALYLRRTVWPSDLCAFYPRPEGVAWLSVITALILLMSITATAVRMRETRPYFITGWLWYLGTLVPVIGLVQVGDQALADRYTYIPLTGIFLMLAWGFNDLATSYPATKKTIAGLAAVVVLAFGWVTWNQTRTWETSESLFNRVLQVTDRNPIAWLNMGEALASRGEHGAAIALYEDALRKDPNNAEIRANLGMLLVITGKDQEATAQFEAALLLNPHQPDAHNGLGTLLAIADRLDEAIRHHQQALESRPRFPQARYNLGKEYAAKGMTDRAIEQLQKAIELKPDYTEAHEKLAAVLTGEKRLADAEPHYRAAIMARPENPDLRFRFAQTLAQMGNLDESVAQLREAVRIRPDWPAALNNLAWFLATRQSSSPVDRTQSVVFAETAARLAGKPDPGSLDTLAAAYAASGRFADAVRKADEAIQLANEAGQNSLSAEIRERAKLYRSGRPYFEK
jgi:protein O-mannosyl-transferase